MSHAVRAITNVLAIVFTVTGLALLLVQPASAGARDRVMLILDSSGSMWGQVEGVNKHLIARKVIGTVLGEIGDTVELGVMAYGHRRKGDCEDIQTLVPVGPVDADRIMERIGSIQPRGKTPISTAVRRAAEDLRFTEEKATIILVSDGLETCDADPCALAEELEKLGINFTVHVVGFDLGNEDTKTLRCLAENTGGVFLQADNADELSEAMGQVVEVVKEPEPEPVVEAEPQPEPEPVAGPTVILPRAYLVKGGEPIGDAYFRVYGIEQDAVGKRKQVTYGNSKMKVEPSRYYVTAERGAALAGVEVDVVEGQENVVEIVLNAGVLIPKAFWTEGGEAVKDAYFRVHETAQDAEGNRKQVTYSGGNPKFTLPANEYYVTAQVGDATVGATVAVVPGEATEIALVLGAGVLVPKAYFAEGEDPIKDAYFRVYEPKAGADGKRKQVTYGGGSPKFKLPAGTYYITAKVGDAIIGREVEVAGGEATEVALILGAGVLTPAAYYTEGGEQVKQAYFRVYEAEEGADGKRKEVTRGGGQPKFKLPAGTYYVTAKIGEAVVGRQVEVAAGQATEVALVLGSGVLSLFASASEGGDPVKQVYFRVFEAKTDIEGKRKQITAGGGQPKLDLPAGKYVVNARWGEAYAEQEVEVKAGELTEATINLDAGRLVVQAVNADGQPVTKGVYYRLFEAKKDIEGKRKQLKAGGGKSMETFVPAGSYLVQVSVGGRNNVAGTVEVTVTAGALSEVQVPVKLAE